jgi:translocation and assembly module TamB
VTRVALRSVIALCAVLSIFVAVAAWVVGTQSGLRTAWRAAASLVPADIAVGRLEGRLAGPLILHDVIVAVPGWRIGVQSVEVEWRPGALIGRTIEVDRLHAAGVDVLGVVDDERGVGDVPEADTAPWRPPESISLPVAVNVEDFAINGLRFRANADAAPILVDAARMRVGYAGRELRVRDIEVSGAELEVRGEATIATEGHYRSQIDLAWRVLYGELPPAAGTVEARGGLNALALQIAVEPPYALDADLLVRELLGELSLEGTVATPRLEPAALGLESPVATVRAELAIAGTLADFAVRGEADVEAPALLDARVGVAVRWRAGALEVETLEIADRNSAAHLSLAGRIDLAPELAVQLGGEWRALRWPLEGEPIATSRRGSLELAGTLEELSARLDAELGPTGRVDGTVRRSGDSVDVALDWLDLAWPESAARLRSDRGSLRVDGVLDAYTLALDADLAATEAATGELSARAAGHVVAEGAGDRRSLALSRLDVAVLDGALLGSGRFTWEPSLSGDVDLELTNLDPGLLLPDWSGRLDGHVLASGGVDEPGLYASVERIEIDGELRGRPVRLEARGAYRAPTAARIERLTFDSGRSLFSASGSIGSDIDVEWEVDSPDLSDLWPQLTGRLESTGRAVGPLRRPGVEGDAEGSGLGFGDIEIGALTFRGRVDPAGVTHSDLVLDLERARIVGREIDRLTLRGDGTADEHRLSAAVAGEDAAMELVLTGVLEQAWQADYLWRFELVEGRLAYGTLAPWTLDSPASGSLDAGGAELGAACWRSGDATLCIDASRHSEDTAVRVVLSALPVRYLEPYLPGGTAVSGTLSAQGDLAIAPSTAPRAAIVLETSAALLEPGVPGAAVPGLAFAPGRAQLVFDGARLDVDVELPLQRGEGGIHGALSVTTQENAPLTSGIVDGSVRAALDDLRFISDLVRGVEVTTGSAMMDVAVTGTVDAPRIAGRIAVENGTARLREPGLVLEELSVTLDGDGSGDIVVSGAVVSGGGLLEAGGSFSLDGSLPVGRLDVRGTEFELFNTPDARVWVSPDLRLDLAPDRLQLTGRVRMPRARFTPREFAEGAVTISEDQIIVDAEETRRTQLARPFYARVDLQLGDDVQFDGLGLTGRLGGALEVVEVPTEPVTGSGELRVTSGTYEAYGQALEVRTGRLLFAGGALARPGIDIEAVRRPTEDILVGARVRGTLNRPELSVFSEPPMPRQEQLSYLLLGRPLESTSTSETSALSQAALALGLRGGNFVSDRLNQALGFDEFGIQSQAAEANSASFVIGKYLTPSLYVSYGVGLFEPVNTLRLRYTISSRWRLVTESSTAASGGDLIYNIERGN